jgi:molecular chaperone DnaJ
MTKRDYYEVLGIGRDASPDEIKKAFRRAAVQHHPDRGGNEEKFKEVNEAYEVLKDPSKRQRYDQFGHAGVGAGNAGGGGGFGAQDFNFDFGDLGLGDIFGSFFGGGFSGAQQSRANRGRDVETNIEINFEEAIFGRDVQIALNIDDICEHCKGTTVEPGYNVEVCPNCKGTGQISRVTRTIFGNIQQATTCPKCSGRGKIPEKLCSVCRGSGTRRKRQTVSLKVPPGIDDGATIRLRSHGEAIANGEKGDLYVNIRVKPDKKFIREGDLILSNEHISMVDAALGTEIEVETVDGPVKMRIPIGTQSGTDFKLSGHGAPRLRGGSRGAHIVTVVVDTPAKLTAHQKKILEQLRDTDSKKGLFR